MTDEASPATERGTVAADAADEARAAAGDTGRAATNGAGRAANEAADGGAAAASGPVSEPPASVVDLAPESAAWDAFVSRSTPGSYLQTTAWAEVKAVNGWTALRFMGTTVARGHATSTVSLPEPVAGRPETVSEEELPGRRLPNDPLAGDLGDDENTVAVVGDAAREAAFGAQVLLRRPRVFPWAFGYAPRGPVMERWDQHTLEAFTAGLRHALASAPVRVSHVRIEPEIELNGPLDRDGLFRHALRRCGWRPGTPIQPPRTRQVDLRGSEEELWGDLRKKWRQYVNKARRADVTVVDADADRLPEFYAIYQETAKRAGFVIRTYESYVEVWRAFARLGMARLLFAQTAAGEGLATLFVLRVGDRVIEPYGGMTAIGAESRANYLLKWEAIRSSRERGATSYDMWGLSHEGIEQFKSGFGGREIRYVGAWDLVLDPAGRLAFDGAQSMQDRIGRWRHGVRGRRDQGPAPAE